MSEPLPRQELFEPATGHVPDARRGIALMIMAVGLFAIMDALVKWLGATYPTVQLIFFRALFAFIPFAFVLFRGDPIRLIRLRDPLWHAVRAVSGLLALGGLFYAFAHMPLADVTAIAFAAPLFITALSVPLLGERVGVRRWSAVMVGFVGVLIMVRPGAGVFDPVAGIALVGTLFYALMLVAVRRLARSNSNATIIFVYLAVSIVISGAFLPFNWVTPDLPDLGLLVALGVVGGLAQIAGTAAYRHAEASVLAPFDYTTILWATLLGFLVWGEIPGNHIWLGVAIVMASGLYILYRETRESLPRPVAPEEEPRR